MQFDKTKTFASAYTNINDPNFNLVPFLEKMPAQIGLLGIQMIWVRNNIVNILKKIHKIIFATDKRR